jgi:hypothetical protein
MIFIVFVTIFVLFAWSRAALRYRDRSISFPELIFWSLVWCSAEIVVLWPGLTGELAAKLGIGRGADLIVYLSIIVLFYLMFRLYIQIGAVERRFTEMVRAIAIEEVKKREKS